MPLTAAGKGIQTGTADAPAGAKELGPIEVVHGRGCGLYGSKGTYEHAYAILRNKAAEMGATYVKILQQEPPHSEAGCYVNRFTIRALTYAAKSAQADAPAAMSSGGDSSACQPPCSPGYACQSDACVALCNPVCSPGFACAQDRTCQPAANAATTEAAR